MPTSNSDLTSSSHRYPTNEAIATALASEGMSGFEELYLAHRRRVYSICFKIVKNHEKAEDLTHEVFIQLSQSLSSFAHRAEFTTWLHRLTVNLVIVDLREQRSSSKKNPIREETMSQHDLTELIDRKNCHQHIEKQLIDSITLESLINKLPPSARQNLLLHDYEGYEYEEIAKITRKHLGTGKSQRYKAVASLRRMLAQEPSVVYKPSTKEEV